METGNALYLHPAENTLEHFLKVSSSLPVFYRNILEVNGEKATDGGIADAIPVREAYSRGATDITVIRSRPSDYVKKQSQLTFILSIYFRKYPRLVKKFKQRARNYMDAVDFIHHPPEGVRVTELAPPNGAGIGRTTQNEAILRATYQIGIDYGNNYLKRRREI
jgi:predicted patatin/cPLA2 family phospholipase